VPEFLRLGAWDLLKGWTGKGDMDFEPRFAMQAINETALCVNRIRKKNSLGHQGFQLVNGMGRLVTDEQIHLLLNSRNMEQSEELMIHLGLQRQLSGHYSGDCIALDPHRIISTSKRMMPKKQKNPDSHSEKMLQTFFSVCAKTGQPIMATMSSSGIPTTIATKKLLNATRKIIQSDSLLVADKEHFTEELIAYVQHNDRFDILTPVIHTKRIKTFMKTLNYKPLWAGYAVSETTYSFRYSKKVFRLLVQRTGETANNYSYKGFITTSNRSAQELLTEKYDCRWSVEDFYNFENKMGMARASTHNLNIRYAKLSLDMIAQAATYQLRKKLKNEYQRWNAEHLSKEVLAWSDGDIKVKDDTIIVTFYQAPKHLNPNDFINLPNKLRRENINPKIPWLYNFKLDFRFK
jgi:hypothetical protein